jgi:hypothetical protein
MLLQDGKIISNNILNIIECRFSRPLSIGLLFSGLCRGRLDCWVADVSIAMLLSSSELVNKLFIKQFINCLLNSLFTSSEEDSSMAIETSATQQSRRPRHNPENNNPILNIL